jgi:hypothetical protein
MPRVGFEPTIRVFERAKTVHVLDRGATVIGLLNIPNKIGETKCLLISVIITYLIPLLSLLLL